MLLFQDLQKLLRDRPDRVVFVVGAGVTLGAVRGSGSEPWASWNGLIRSGLERAHALGKLSDFELDDYLRQLGHMLPNSLINVASVVEQTLGAPENGEFRRWLRETVGSFENDLRDRSVLDALAEHQRRGAVLVTTNYDLLLEHVTRLPAVTWRDPVGVDRLLREFDDPQILHLHGAWRWPDSVVLGLRSYEDILRDQHARAVLTTLRADRTLVFVGYGAGLSDPNLGAFLKWTGAIFAGSEARHFRLCRDAEIATLRAEHPDGQRIFPLSYGPNHVDLPSFLLALLSPTGSSLRPISAPPPIPPPASPVQISTTDIRPTPATLVPTPKHWQQALVKLFESAFTNEEILRFFVMSLDPSLASGLPGVDIEHETFCFKAVELLQRHHSCDHQFFEALRLSRQHRRPEINAIQLVCLGTLSPPPPPLPSQPVPDQDAVALHRFALVLDRTSQWLTFTGTLRDERRHVFTIVHGDGHQDIGLFIRRTLRWATGSMGDQHPRAHEVIPVQCYQEQACPRSTPGWDNRLMQALATRNVTGRTVNDAMKTLTERSAGLVVFIGQNNGGLVDGGADGFKVHERYAFRDFLKSLVAALPADAAHPLRILVPVEHAPEASSTDGLLEAVREAANSSRSVQPLSLQELDFPKWSEVRDSLQKEIQRRGHECRPADIEQFFRPTFNRHNELQNAQMHSFAALGIALGEILDNHFPENPA